MRLHITIALVLVGCSVSSMVHSACDLACGPIKDGSYRGHCEKNHDNMPGIVAAFACLDRTARSVKVDMLLETDDACRGPCAYATVVLYDKDRRAIFERSTKKQCKGGKDKPHAVDDQLKYSESFEVSQDVSQASNSIAVSVTKTQGDFRRNAGADILRKKCK